MQKLSVDIQGQSYYDQLASQSVNLRWSTITQDIILRGDSDLNSLQNLKNIILTLREQFRNQGPRVQVPHQRRDDFSKRLLLLQKQVEGLMKRRINFSVKDQMGGSRVLDYTCLLNQKQNSIIDLQKKIQNLEERLRRASYREVELQAKISNYLEELKNKQKIIVQKNQFILSEIAFSNSLKDAIDKIKINMSINRSKVGQFQKLIFDKVDLSNIAGLDNKYQRLTGQYTTPRSKLYQLQSETQKNKTKVIQLMRDFQQLLKSNEITSQQIQRILQGFLLQFDNTKLYEKTQLALERNKIQQQYNRLNENFTLACEIYKINLAKLKKDNPGLIINLDDRLFTMLGQKNVKAYSGQKEIVYIESFIQKTIQVPAQQNRTKYLLHSLTSILKKLTTKYPKLLKQIDQRMAQFIKEEVTDVIEVNEFQRLVQIVKYKPQVIRVENVYCFNNEKSKKIQFHLRVLIKALLQQLQKIKIKTGVVLQLDEGIIGMIRQQILDVVDVDDILKVFKVVPKIVEVQKIVEKIVERLVEVPKIIPIQKIVEKIIEIQKIVQVERTNNVPLQIPKIVQNIIEKIVPIENIIEKIVEVPTICERVIELRRQVPKIVQVQVFKEKIVEVDKIIEIEKVVNHVQTEIREVEIIREKIVTIQKIIEKIVEVPVIVERIVEKIVEVPKIIEVQKIVQKIIPQIQYRNAREVHNHVEIQHVIVDRIVEKPIPIIQYKEKIIQVPKIMEKIVQTTNTKTELKEVQVIRQIIVVQERIKEIQKIRTQIVETIKEVPVQIEKIIEVPIIHEILVRVQQFIQKPIIQRIQKIVIKEVKIRDPIIIYESKIVEVQNIVNHIIEVPKIVKCYEDRIVQVPQIIDRIKQVKVEVDKIIQKMVEVPKVVEVQKIVQKVVVIPRIIEKVVEVPQFVEKIVQKEIIKQTIKQVQKIVQVPVFHERIVQLEKPKNIYIEVEKIVEKVIDRLVQVPVYEEKIVTKEVFIQKVVQLLREVPKQLKVEKITPLYVEAIQVLEVDRPIIVPVQVPVPIQRIVQKLVPKQQIVERIVQVPQIVQKIVTVKEEIIQIRQIEKIIERIVIDKQIKQIERIVPYIQQVIKQIPTIVQKIVPITNTVEQIITVQQIVEKVVEKVITMPKMYEVQKIEQILVQVPKFIQIEKIVPQLIKVNNYINKIVQKIVEVPLIIEQMKQIQVKAKDNIVQVRTHDTKIIEVQKIVKEVVILQRFKQVIKNINHIQQVLEVVDRYEQIPIQLIAHQERLVQVPYILEKIVQKVIIMPQIVEVLKYVHQVCETEETGVALGVDIALHQQSYKELSKNLKIQLSSLMNQLKTMRQTNTLKNRIAGIQKFLLQLEKFINFPKIVTVPVQKIKEVEVQKIVRVPMKDENSVRIQLSMSLLIQKLIQQLNRIKKTTNINLQLEDQIKFIFFTEFGSKWSSQQFNKKLGQYAGQIQKKFETLGSWSYDHQMMLNSFLQDRFVMAGFIQQANKQIQIAKEVSEKRLEGLKRYKNDKIAYEQFLNKITGCLQKCEKDLRVDIGEIYRAIQGYKAYSNGQVIEPTKFLSDIQINDQRLWSLLRQKDSQIEKLKSMLFSVEKQLSNLKKLVEERGSKQLIYKNKVLQDKINELHNVISQYKKYEATAQTIPMSAEKAFDQTDTWQRTPGPIKYISSNLFGTTPYVERRSGQQDLMRQGRQTYQPKINLQSKLDQSHQNIQGQSSGIRSSQADISYLSEGRNLRQGQVQRISYSRLTQPDPRIHRTQQTPSYRQQQSSGPSRINPVSYTSSFRPTQSVLDSRYTQNYPSQISQQLPNRDSRSQVFGQDRSFQGNQSSQRFLRTPQTQKKQDKPQ